MAATMNPLDTLSISPEDESYSVSPAETCLGTPELEDEIKEEGASEKKATKKRKSWGQELPTPKTNLPPRYALVLTSASTSANAA